MKMDFTAKDLQRRIEEVKNDNDPDQFCTRRSSHTTTVKQGDISTFQVFYQRQRRQSLILY